jgi:DNA adenine methylase
MTHTGAPFLRWAGSKRRLLPLLSKFWNNTHQRYVEPFAGSACLFFAIRPCKALLGDLNPELIATYRQVKASIDDVLKELSGLGPAKKSQYLRLRSMDISTLTPSSRAARFIYLNRFCFNGIYRTNLKGQFNVPYSGYGCGSLPSPEIFRGCSKQLQNAQFVNGDFEQVLLQTSHGDFVYMDPPYATSGRRVFREYDPSTFAVEDILRLRSWMERLDRAKISFVVSYAQCAEADILRRGFSCEVVEVRRNIAGFAAHRSRTKEFLISNT